MQKEIKNYKINLIMIIACFIIAIIFNNHLFNYNSFPHLLYGIVLIGLLGLTSYCFVLINENLYLSSKIATIIGHIMTIISFIEGFMYGKGFIINFRITFLFIMVGCILIFKDGKKIKNNI